MILGTGIDMVEIARIKALHDKQGEAFEARILTEQERSYINASEPHKIARFAKRFAAKEAAAKAMGKGIGENARFTDIEVIKDDAGKPSLQFHGKAQLWMELRKATAHLSLSDDGGFAIAQVIIEAPSDSA